MPPGPPKCSPAALWLQCKINNLLLFVGLPYSLNGVEIFKLEFLCALIKVKNCIFGRHRYWVSE